MTFREPPPGGPSSRPPGFPPGREDGPAAGTGAVPWALAVAGLAAAAVWHSGSLLRPSIAPASLHLHAVPARPPRVRETVSVLLPIRHDSGTAVTAVRAALAQKDVDRLDVVVLDYGCPQETRSALRGEFGDDPRLRILGSAALPAGWAPRPHRAHQLAVAARGPVLLFADPGAPLGPLAAAAATALLRREGLDLAILDSGRPPAPDGSPLDTLAGHLLRPGRRQPGRFTLVVDAVTYWRTGGYRSTGADPDPLALLRTVRRANGRAAVADARRVIPPTRPAAPAAPVRTAARRPPEGRSGTGLHVLTAAGRRILAALAEPTP